MRAVVQRVRSSRVVVSGTVVGEIGPGLLVLLGVRTGDAADQARWMADKVVGLRVFEDDQGKMNRSLLETGGSVLAVSQFTLYGDVLKGRRPSFIDAARPEVAEPLYQAFVNAVRLHGVPVATGVFGADMAVELVNDGPVTLVIDAPAPPP
ncbi:MAG TPA: D-aminoacyl-tRNA deacylase [Gemmataceae bacterium]|jgi:D-tyrosyl-tRNA(Tyr) deacylase|nr:D-aminoacyl-tRNA deacylase [Gemmataceae bacterium]